MRPDLAELKAQQLRLAARVSLEDAVDPLKVRYVGGGDLTFMNIWKTPTTGLGAFVVLDLLTGEVMDRTVVEDVVDFPYIPTFLAYRELPLLVKAYRSLKVKPEVSLIDGQGIAHPRKMGIAAHFGVYLGVPSVGVAKSRLVGEYEEPPPYGTSLLYLNGEHIGWVLRKGRGKSLLFISPGHKVSVKTSLDIVRRILQKKLPLPTRLAHNLLQEERRKRAGKRS